jgi:hypothetical protein
LTFAKNSDILKPSKEYRKMKKKLALEIFKCLNEIGFDVWLEGYSVEGMCGELTTAVVTNAEPGQVMVSLVLLASFLVDDGVKILDAIKMDNVDKIFVYY